MSVLVIKAFPDHLHARLMQTAAAHRRSVTEETIHLLEKALTGENLTGEVSGAQRTPQGSYWANRKLVPEYEAALEAGAFSGGCDSSVVVSEERDAR